MNKSEEYTIQKDRAFMEHVVHEMRTIPKRPPSTDQAESTKRALEAQALRTQDEDAAYWARPMAEDWKAVKDATTLDETVGYRDCDASQVSHVESVRRRAKNQIGASMASSMTPEKRERAVDAFYHTPPAILTKEQEARAATARLGALEMYDYAKNAKKEVASAMEEQAKKEYRVWLGMRVIGALLFVGISLGCYFLFFHESHDYRPTIMYKGKL